MPRYVIEMTSENFTCPQQFDYEAVDEVEALRHFISHHSPIARLLTEREGEQYKGWKKIELSIGPAVCDECFEPSPDTAVCAECQADARMEEEEPLGDEQTECQAEGAYSE